jgi:hypothetical protein
MGKLFIKNIEGVLNTETQRELSISIKIEAS